MISRVLAAALMAFACSVSGAAKAQSPYRLTILGDASFPVFNAIDINDAGDIAAHVLPGDGTNQMALRIGDTWVPLGPGIVTAINNAGQAVGQAQSATGSAVPTLWDGARPTVLSGLSTADAINDRGQVAGSLNTPEGGFAALWQAGSTAILGPGGSIGINAAGHVAGWASTATGTLATVWDSSGRTLFSALGGVAFDVNDRDQAVGLRFVTGVGPLGHLWDGDRSIDLNAPGGGPSDAVYEINTLGQAVGLAGGHAMLWDDGTAIDLNSLLRPSAVEAGWVLERANAINEQGWIVGMAYNRIDCPSGASCDWRGFLLSVSDLPDQWPGSVTPVPEPSTYALMIAGLCAIGVWAQRKRAANASR